MESRVEEIIAKFPAGALQFEVGVQTFDVATTNNISRDQDYGCLVDNFEFLRRETGVHIHADLIITSTHGFTGLKHVLMGSTAEHVVRKASCPVLVVRQTEHDFV